APALGVHQHPVALRPAPVDRGGPLAHRLARAAEPVGVIAPRERVERRADRVGARAPLDAEERVVVERRAHDPPAMRACRSAIARISSSLSPPSRLTRTLSARPVSRSFANTPSVPSASITNVTPIFTAPRGAGRSPLSSTSPSGWFSLIRRDSPW